VLEVDLLAADATPCPSFANFQTTNYQSTMKREQTKRKLTLTPDTLANLKVLRTQDLQQVHGRFDSANPPCTAMKC
jgi:hypothetical protein